MDGEVFLDRVARYRAERWRLVLINATSILPEDGQGAGSYDITWSFATDRKLEHVREHVLPGEPVPSIGGSYPSAYLYENEMRELFGVNVTGLAVDFKGQLYQTATRVPFSPSAIRARLDASGRREHAVKKP